MENLKKEEIEKTATLFQTQMDFIKTIAFISIEDGMWEKYVRNFNILDAEKIKEWNEKLSIDAKERFAKDKVFYTMLSKHNGEKNDKTLVLYNIPFNYVENIAKRGLQEGFVWLVKYYDGTLDFSRYALEGGVDAYFQYINKKIKNRKLKMTSSKEKYTVSYIEQAVITELKSTLDFNGGVCAKLKSFGLNLDLETFEGVLREFDKRIQEIYPQVKTDATSRKHLSDKIYDSIYHTGAEDRRIINSGGLFAKMALS